MAAHTPQQMGKIRDFLGLKSSEFDLAPFKGQDDDISNAAPCAGLRHKRGPWSGAPPVKLNGFKNMGYVCFIVDEAD